MSRKRAKPKIRAQEIPKTNRLNENIFGKCSTISYFFVVCFPVALLFMWNVLSSNSVFLLWGTKTNIKERNVRVGNSVGIAAYAPDYR